MSQLLFPCGIPRNGAQRCPKHGFPADCEDAIRKARHAEENPPKPEKSEKPEEDKVADSPPKESLPSALKELRTKTKRD